MNIEAKRNELSNWVLGLDEEMLIRIDELKNSKTSDGNVVAYSTKGESFTEQQYKKHINDIRESVKNGAKTYSSKEVREYVLNGRRL